MSAAYGIGGGSKEFAAARQHYGYLVERLHSEETQHLEHGAVEAFLDRGGTELLRRLRQGHLDVRTRREVEREAVVGADGVERTLRIRQGKSSEVAAGMRRSATLQGFSAKDRERVDGSDYLIAHRKYLHYDENLRRDGPLKPPLPVAVGACSTQWRGPAASGKYFARASSFLHANGG